MADKIRGITIELNGDTSGLTKSLNDANGAIKDTKSQLQDVERLLKLDPDNVELLRQKEVLLNKEIAETKTKLDTLKQAEETMKSQGVDENSEQFMALQREIIATQSELDKLTDTAKDTKSAFDKIKDATDAVAKGADNVAQKTKKLSAAGAVVAGSLIGAGVSAVKSADELKTLSARTGLSTDMLQKFAYASDMVDVSTEEMASAMSKMKRQMDKNPDAFAALGVEVRNEDGTFRDLESVFYDSLAALSQITDETERDLAAMELFGKGADSLATIIDDGGESLKEYGQKAEDLGLIMDESTIDKMVETGDSFDEMKARATATFTELGATLMDKLGPAIDTIIGAIESVINWIGTLDGDTLETILIIAGVVAAISPLATAISGISTLIGAVSSAISFLLANPVVLLIAGIVALVALIVTKGDEIKAVLQNVDDFLSNIFATDFSEEFGILGDVINVFVGIVEGIWTTVKGTLDGVIDFVQGVFSGDWDQAWTGIKEIVDGVLDGIQKTFDAVTSWMSDIFEKDWSESLGAVGEVLNGLFKSVSDVWEDIKGVFNGIIDFIKNVFSGDWGAAWENVKTVFSGIFETLGDVAKTPINVIIGLINGLIDGINWVIDGINSVSFDIPDWVPGIGGAHVGFNIGKIGKLAYLAQGGILTAGSAVVGEAGPELLTMMGDRAIVQPLTNSTTNTTNMGGIVLNVYGAAGQNVQELADIIMDEIANATERREAALA